MPTISVLIEGGKATAAAPLGPALGPLGINIGQVVAKINEDTKSYAGMKVPVKIHVATDKSFEIAVGSPPMSAVIKKEAGIDKATKDPKREFVADLSMDQAIKIAKTKEESFSSYKLKSQVNEVLGTCDSMGIKIEGKRAKETIKDVLAGKYDSKFGGVDKGVIEAPEPDPEPLPVEEKKEKVPAAGDAKEEPAAEEKKEEKPAQE